MRVARRGPRNCPDWRPRHADRGLRRDRRVPELNNAAPLASASRATRPKGSGVFVSTIATAAFSQAAFHLGIRQICIDRHPTFRARRGLAEHLHGLRLPVGRRQDEPRPPVGPRRQKTRDRRHGFPVAFVVQRAADGAGSSCPWGPRLGRFRHVQPVWHGPHRPKRLREIHEKPVGAVLAHEGEFGDPAKLSVADDPLYPARGRFLVSVAVQDHRQAARPSR